MKKDDFLYFTVGVLAVIIGVLGYAYLAGEPAQSAERPVQSQEFGSDAGMKDIVGSFEKTNE